MSSLYGYKWTKAYGNEPDPDKVWQAALSDVSYEQMMFGMNLITKQGKEWPPSAPEFRKISLNIEEGVGVVRTPSVEATAKNQGLRALTHKRSEAEIEKAVSKIGNLRGLLK